jgi:predicted CXXCH cytochrome family protein
MKDREVARAQTFAADSGGPSNQHPQRQRKEVGTVRRWSLLLAGGLLWLFLAAIPALADGGPHLTSVNSGTSTLTADSCAGCHRAHTAQGEYLLAAASEEALCLSCHGNASTGATTNVEWGIQFAPNVDGTRNSGVELGALRDGGFLKARIAASDPVRVTYIRGYENSPINTEFAISTRPKVGVLGASADVNSAHIDLSESAGDGIADMKTVWGKGALVATTPGNVGTPSVTLTCVECHNPHGNGQYRILRPVPGVEADPLGEPEPMEVKATYANFNTIVTESQHGFTVGDKLTLTGVGGLANGDYYVVTVTNGFTFKVSLTFGGTVSTVTTTTPAAGTATGLRAQVAIADVSVDPDGNPANGVENPTKNYTVLQTKGAQGVDSTFLLYARDVLAARDVLPGGVNDNQPAVAITSAPLVGSTYNFQTTLAHGLAVGDLANVASDGTIGGWTPGAGPYTVAGVGSSGSVYDRFTLVGVTLSAGGLTGTTWTVTRLGIPGVYTAAGGDYFRRTVPWNPALINPGCLNTVFSSTNSQYCGTMNDAPNGRPGTISPPSTGTGPASLYGQQAFLDQMSPWCSQCHTRYYQNSNENLENAEPISAISNRPIGRINSNQIYPTVYATTTTQYGAPAYGDRVTFAGVTSNTVLNAMFDIASVSGGTFTTGAAHGFVVGQSVVIGAGVTGLAAGEYVVATASGSDFTLTTGAPAIVTYSAPYPTVTGAWYVMETGGSASSGSASFKVSRTQAGTAQVLTNDNSGSGLTPAYSGTIGTFTRVYQSSNSGWGYPREDSIYKFQHSTASNRACTVCHVAHGSNAAMPGQNGTTFSANVKYPDGVTVSTSSRLLKINNRGTCQMCHDPTGTVPEGTPLGNATYLLQVP